MCGWNGPCLCPTIWGWWSLSRAIRLYWEMTRKRPADCPRTSVKGKCLMHSTVYTHACIYHTHWRASHSNVVLNCAPPPPTHPRLPCSSPQVDVRNEGDLCGDRGGGGCEVFLPSGVQTTGSLTPASTHSFNKVMNVDEGTETCAFINCFITFFVWKSSLEVWVLDVCYLRISTNSLFCLQMQQI